MVECDMGRVEEDGEAVGADGSVAAATSCCAASLSSLVSRWGCAMDAETDDERRVECMERWERQ